MKWPVVFFICLAFSIFLISPILSTLPATPPDTVNMMVGHYFEDYYEYLSFIKQGQKGSLILENLFDSTDRVKITIPWWPYSLLGFLGNLFHLQIPAQLIYWFSSVAFCFIILLTTFTAVKTLLPGEKFSFQLLAFLLIIFSCGFFNIFDILKTPIQIIPYDFWYSIGPPFSRYNIGTPHHQATQIILILALLFSIARLHRPYALATLGGHLMFSFLLLILSPPQLILFWLSYVTTVGLIIISNLKSQNSKLSVRQAQDPEYIEGQLKSQNYKDNTTKPKVSILETDLIESQILNIPFLNFRTGDTIGGFTLNGFTMKGTPSKGAVRLADEHLMGVNRGRTRKLESGEKLDTEALYNSEKF
ncbi:hypothetical protein FJY90_06885, partial [Candidatus Gottesmanbacteria bacterium]|nr:hypothetical protein [Candidatus Gottesmanbacteria bacterium]